MMPHRADNKSLLLADLLPGLSGIDWARHQTVSSLALDSREIERNGLWLALQGTQAHALEHFADARRRGAAAGRDRGAQDPPRGRVDRHGRHDFDRVRAADLDLA